MDEQQKKRLYLLVAGLIIVTLIFLYMRSSQRIAQQTALQLERVGTPTPTPTVNPTLVEFTSDAYTFYHPETYEQREDPNAQVTFVNPEPNSVGGTNAISVLAPDPNVFRRDLLYTDSQCKQIAYVGVPKDLKPKLKQTIFVNKKDLKGCINIYTTDFKFMYIDYQVYKVPAKLPIQTYRLVTGYPEAAEKTDEAKQLLGSLYQFSFK